MAALGSMKMRCGSHNRMILILVLTVILSIVGSILVWAAGSDTSKGEDYGVPFSILICLLMLGAQRLGEGQLAVMAGVMALSVLDAYTTAAHGHSNTKRKLPMTGYIIVVIGIFISFVAVSISLAIAPVRSKRTLIFIGAGIMLVVGNIILWVAHEKLGGFIAVTPTVVAFCLLAGHLMGWHAASSVASYGSALLLAGYISREVTVNSDSAKIGFACVNIGFLLVIFLQVLSATAAYEYPLQPRTMKNRIRSLPGITLIFSVVLALIGAILVWAAGKQTRKLGDMLVGIGLLSILCNCITHFLHQPGLALIGTCLAFSPVHVFGIAALDVGLPLCDFYITESKAHKRQKSARAGYALVFVGVLLACFAIVPSVKRLLLRSKWFVIVVVAALFLLVGTILGLFSDKLVDFIFSPALVGFHAVFTASSGIIPIADFAFVIPSHLFFFYWIWMIHAKGIALVAFILIIIGIVLLLIVRAVNFTTSIPEVPPTSPRHSRHQGNVYAIPVQNVQAGIEGL